MANGEKEGVGWGRRLVFLEPLLNQLCKDSQKLQASWVPSGQGRLQRLQTAKMVLSQGGLPSPPPPLKPSQSSKCRRSLGWFVLNSWTNLCHRVQLFFFFFLKTIAALLNKQHCQDYSTLHVCEAPKFTGHGQKPFL